MILDLADDIYEAAVISERWPRILETISNRTESAFGSLFVISPDQSMRWTGTEASNKLISDFATLDVPIENPRIALATDLALRGFCTDQDIAGDGSLFDHPFYQDFLYPRGYGWVAATTFAIPTGEYVYVSFERERNRGNMEPHFVDALNALRPHLGRSASLAARLGLERARGMAQALGEVGIPCAVLRRSGSLYQANSQFQKLLPDVVLDTRDRIHFVNIGADALLADTISRLGSNAGAGQSRSIPVAARDGYPAFVFHLIPLRGAANDIFSNGLALLIATPVDKSLVPTAEVLQGLFDLTPAEARVARAIAEAKPIDAIALASGVSRETIRSQLAAVLAKTGLSRQAELVSLLSGKGLPTSDMAKEPGRN